MPVIFRGSSEYDRNYRWNQSYRSATFSPNLEQNAIDAGLRSDQVGFVNGPRITTKKKVWHREPEVQHCLNWWPESDSGTPVTDDAEVDQSNMPNAASTINKTVKSRTVKRDSEKNKAQKKRIQKSPPKSPKKGTLSHRNNSFMSPVKQGPTSNIKSPQKEGTGKQNSTSRGKKKGEKHIPTNRADTSGNMDQDVTHPKTIVRHERNIPLERKAGMNPNGIARKSKARLSEYQRNFAAPKFSVKPSPVLSALDVVHSSSPAIPPHSGMQFNKSSEYISKYGSPRNDKRRQTATSPGSPSMKLRVKDMQRPYLTHNNKKGFRSEYKSQYEPTHEFDVGELRKMAEDNKQKHEGTHIDPDHATQVISPFNKLWEVSTDDGTVRSETGSGDNQNAKDERERQIVKEVDSEEKWSRMSQKGSDSVEDITEAAEVETLVEADSLDEQSEVSRYSVERKHAWTEETNPDEIEEQSQNSQTASVLEGRVSTPRLHEIGGALRTHHDLTTPCVGGAILTSPKQKSDARSTSEMSLQDRDRQKPRVAGSPTRDYHALLEGRPHRLVRSSPQPLLPKQSKCPQKSIGSKEPPKVEVSKSTKSRSQSAGLSPTMKKRSLATTAPIRGSLRNNEFQHCGPTGRPQTAAILLQRDDDALSVASSHTSARATELLQRAKNRKSFWTTT